MTLKITTLSENTAAGPGCTAEWGLSIFIQTDDMNLMLDTGAGLATLRNAEKAELPLKTVKKIVLSHAHADHSGGIRDVLQRTSRPEVIAHPAVWVPKYKKMEKDPAPVYNGIPFAREELEKYADFTLSKDPVRITDTILTTGEVERQTEFETIEPYFFRKEQDRLVPDDFPDDRALIFKTDKGLVIVSGCAHRGIVNTILHARKITGENRVHTVIGGTHLYPKKDVQIEQTVRALNELGVEHIGVSHCTGLTAAMQLRQSFGDRFFLNNAGNQMTIEE
jgi:7,8-dihydropterin-6-yl-methyl-4-(beta-D-ribofuranosyl)aminobenzene 5'-phosphate synthase